MRRKSVFDGLENDLVGLVETVIWKARMSNGAVFQIRTFLNVSRKEARKRILEFANSCCPEDPAYFSEDIENMWKVSGKH